MIQLKWFIYIQLHKDSEESHVSLLGDATTGKSVLEGNLPVNF